MDIASFELFLTVARLQSISKAAQALFLAQSTSVWAAKDLFRLDVLAPFHISREMMSRSGWWNRFFPISRASPLPVQLLLDAQR